MTDDKWLLSLICFGFFVAGNGCSNKPAATEASLFKKVKLTTEFLSEGVAAGDINQDGKTDIIAGYYWFEAPDWKRHAISPSRAFDPGKEYSNSFLNYAMDVNFDGWTDLLLVDFPGKPALWFENPKNQEGPWKQHIVGDSVGIANESPAFVDVDGDGRTDLLCADAKTKQMVWLSPPRRKGDSIWTRYAISQENAPATDIYSHGLGYGDINNDGRKDVIITGGWWQGPNDPKQGNWTYHAASLGAPCSQMHALDVNADGKTDVVSASAHQLGIWWYQQSEGAGSEPVFKRHLISEAVSQTHSSILADINEDGKPDLITGKRYLAHHASNDPGTYDPPLLLWFESTPGKSPYWVEHPIDNDSGAGLNIVAQDMNKDGLIDVVIANKKGVFLFERIVNSQ